MNWTHAKDLRAQVQKLWDKGELLRPLAGAGPFVQKRLRLTGPSSGELSEHFDEVRAWATELRAMPHVRLVLREFRHRVLGNNALPDEVWLDSLEAAHAMLGKQKEGRRFVELVQTTQQFTPQALAWLVKRPLAALELFDAWSRLLSVVAWLQAHPRPGIYLRQVDLPGVDSKFIEAHRSVLSELFDLVLPEAAVDASATGLTGFCHRYGFRDKPLRIRFRLLDAALLPGMDCCCPALDTVADPDITLTQTAFEGLNLPVQRVFITENEVNFLAFPSTPGSMVIFGAGYGFEALAGAAWLHCCELHYWGDIDTHGYAILDQLRAHFPHARSLLMDRATLLAHAQQWGDEPQPLLRDLPRLTPDEALVFNDLRDNRLRVGVRLEQERIGFACLQAALRLLPVPDSLVFLNNAMEKSND
jgi:hypothetical protein